MIWLFAFFILLILLVVYLLFAPLHIEINSMTGICKMRYSFLVSARIFIMNEMPQLELKILGFRKIISLLEKSEGEQPVLQKKKQLKPAADKRKKIPLKKILAVLQSFKVKKFYLTLCFNDMAVNGISYPLFWWIKRKTGKNVEINFVGENQFVFYATNNAFRMLRAYIKA